MIVLLVAQKSDLKLHHAYVGLLWVELDMLSIKCRWKTKDRIDLKKIHDQPSFKKAYHYGASYMIESS